MALKDILTTGTYADEMVIALPDGSSATIGEMRSMASTERAALLARAQQLELAEQGVMTRVTKLREANLLDDQMNPVIPTARQVEQHVAAATGMDESDPLFGPLVKETRAAAKAQAEQLAAMQRQVAQIAQATQQAVKGYLDDNYNSVFQREVAALPEPIRSKVTLEQAVNFATKRNLTDDLGRLDIHEAVDRLTWDARKEAELSTVKVQKAEIDEGRKALEAMQRPGVHGPRIPDTGFKGVDDKGKTLSLDEAIAAAGQDDEIWSGISKYAGVGQA
jgi:hypothetical protein